MPVMNRQHLTILLSFLLGMGLWVGDALLDAQGLPDNSFWQRMFTRAPAWTILFRCLAAGSIVGFALWVNWLYEPIRRNCNRFRRASKTWDAFFLAVTHPILVLAPDRTVLQANQAAQRAYGPDGEPLIGRDCRDVFQWADLKQACCSEESWSGSLSDRMQENEMVLHGRAYLVYCTPVRDKRGKLLHIIHISTDITPRKQAEEKLKAHDEQLRCLASEISLAEERQRRTIATSLHDNVGQALAFSKMKLGQIGQETLVEEVREPLREIADMIERSIIYTRDLTFQLSPPILYDVGLEAALQWLLEQAGRKHGLQTEFVDDGQVKPLQEDMRVFLFQAARELVFNAVKHASARHLEISVRRTNRHIQVQVSDDGAGFDSRNLVRAEQGTRGFGLFNVRERLIHFGGQFDIQSQSGRGTRVTLTAPLAETTET